MAHYDLNVSVSGGGSANLSVSPNDTVTFKLPSGAPGVTVTFTSGYPFTSGSSPFDVTSSVGPLTVGGTAGTNPFTITPIGASRPIRNGDIDVIINK